MIEQLFFGMCGQNRSDNASGTAPCNDFGETVGFDESLDHSDVIHAHDGSSAQKESTPAHCVPDLPEEL